MKIKIMLVLVSSFVLASTAMADRYWPSVPLDNWYLQLNNGVAYIGSKDFPTHCKYGRGQINMDGTEFNKAQYAYAMSAKARGASLRYVVDSDQSICVITGLSEVEVDSNAYH